LYESLEWVRDDVFLAYNKVFRHPDDGLLSRPTQPAKALRYNEAFVPPRRQHLQEFTMAIPHAASGQVIDIQPLAGQLQETRTVALFKSDELEVMRLILPAGKTVPPHHVKGELTVQCLEGEVAFTAATAPSMKAGQLLWLEGGVEYSVTAVQRCLAAGDAAFARLEPSRQLAHPHAHE
jgi:quercetin dioxygenase-like cupin family protein